MKGFRLNPDKKYVSIIVEGLEKKEGHCPCRVNVDDSKKIIKYLYDTYKDNIIISIMNQYTPVCKINDFPNLNRKLTDEEYDEVIDYACSLGIENAFVQEGETQSESFIPDFDSSII